MIEKEVLFYFYLLLLSNQLSNQLFQSDVVIVYLINQSEGGIFKFHSRIQTNIWRRSRIYVLWWLYVFHCATDVGDGTSVHTCIKCQLSSIIYINIYSFVYRISGHWSTHNALNLLTMVTTLFITSCLKLSQNIASNSLQVCELSTWDQYGERAKKPSSTIDV